jgi:2-polyprenyl-3-methyl-5-hydroxy-6-metoxy-1,4-benzoquinol methylase
MQNSGRHPTNPKAGRGVSSPALPSTGGASPEGGRTEPPAAWRQALRSLDYHVGAMIRWRWLRQAVAPLLNQPRTERGMEYQGALQVLDAGSGNGDFAFRLARRYARATIHGVDIDGEHVAACQARLGATPLPNLTFAQADLTESVGTKVYDLTYSVDVLEHISDDQAALANLARALRPGGRLIIHTPLTPQHHWLRRFDLERCPRADHVRQGYNEEDLQAKVRASGLEITSVRHTHGRWGTLAWELWMLARPYPLAKVLLWPLAMLLISLEMASPSDWHNCILLQARLSPQAASSGGAGSRGPNGRYSILVQADCLGLPRRYGPRSVRAATTPRL